jgi:hypothetical protein
VPHYITDRTVLVQVNSNVPHRSLTRLFVSNGKHTCIDCLYSKAWNALAFSDCRSPDFLSASAAMQTLKASVGSGFICRLYVPIHHQRISLDSLVPL